MGLGEKTASPFRNITWPTSVSRLDNTLKGSKIHRYNDIHVREIAKTPISPSSSSSSSSENSQNRLEFLSSFLHKSASFWPA